VNVSTIVSNVVNKRSRGASSKAQADQAMGDMLEALLGVVSAIQRDQGGAAGSRDAARISLGVSPFALALIFHLSSSVIS
jgi:hypothetical protein